MSDEFPSICPVCSKEERDGLLCHECGRKLFGCLASITAKTPTAPPAPKRGKLVGHERMPVRDLWPAGSLGRRQALPWETPAEGWNGLERELMVSYTRSGQRGRNLVGGRSSDKPVPWDEGASNALAHLRATLVIWCRDLRYDDEPWPDDDLPAIAQWLLDRKVRIRGHQDVALMYFEVIGAVNGAQWVIDTRPVRTLVGPCPICGNGDVYAARDAETGICKACAEVIPGIPEMRQRNDELIKAMHVSRREVLPALTDVYGLQVKDGTLKKWIQRGKLVADRVRVQDREPLFKVEDVLGLAADLRGSTATSVEEQPPPLKRRRVRTRKGGAA